jgi:hypothetical protein
MLNEGVHVDNIDGVILLRPTVSPILYLQQIGRSLASGKEKQPLIFDIVNNFESLYSIDSLRSEITEAFAVIPCAEKGKTGFTGNFRIYDEAGDSRKLFEQLEKNLSAGWESYYLEAKEFYEIHKNLDIPKAYVTEHGRSLGTWLMTQRRIRSGKIAGTLTEEQIAKLDALGMNWESGSSRNWNRGYQALAAYKEQFGDVDVKANYVTEDGYALGKWVTNLRSRWSRGEVEDNYRNALSDSAGTPARLSATILTNEQIAKLDELGMIWDKHEHQWMTNYRAAEQYYRKNGNLRVPRKFRTEGGICLGIWLDNQRSTASGVRRGAAPLSAKRKGMLDAIGMIWN